jgi:hypothetical protein
MIKSYYIILILIIIIIIIIIIIKLRNNYNNDYIVKNLFFDNNIKKSKKIHIWYGETNDKIIKYMYKPGVISIISILNEIFNYKIEIDHRNDYYNFDEINKDDTIIWVGCVKIPNFNHLKEKGIYTIYYNTEPDLNNPGSDEIWTYSKYLFYKYNKNNNNQIIQFIPIICEENVPFISYNSKDNNMKLIFLGKLDYRPIKKIFLLTNSFLKENLLEIYNIWNDNDFNKLINEKPYIFLNILKLNTNILPSFRINKLLSHKCIIISEHTNKIDEELYNGLVYFCNINEIESVYKKIINKTNNERQIESNNKYNIFYNIFNSKNAINLIIHK